jgi:epoxyqueuosine reductase
VDTGPVSEKYLATHAGLGWLGKNTNLISENHGSFFFLGVLLLNCICNDFSNPTDHCGTCTSCIEACPTDAIIEPYLIDSRLCLSHETIERKTPTSIELQQRGKWIYGCDDCQTCCPYNRFSKFTTIGDFQPRDYSIEGFLNLDEDTFLKCFEGSPIRRTGYEHFMENVLAQVAKEPEKYESQIMELSRRTESKRIKKRIAELFERISTEP